MNFKIELSKDKFSIINVPSEVAFSGSLYDYNQIQFITISGGMVQWLQDYLQFEQHEAIHIAEQLNNWQNFINQYNDKE